jgi:hypothetical protein
VSATKPTAHCRAGIADKNAVIKIGTEISGQNSPGLSSFLTVRGKLFDFPAQLYGKYFFCLWQAPRYLVSHRSVQGRSFPRCIR